MAKNLRKLYLNYNNINQIDGLSKFDGIEVLYLSKKIYLKLEHNKITSLKGL